MLFTCAEDHQLNRRLVEAVGAGWAGQPNYSRERQFLLADPPNEAETLRAFRAGCDAEGHADDVISDSVELPISLVIWGERDRYLLPGNLDGLKQFVPDLTILRVADGSHWVVHEKPTLVNAAVRKFL